MYLKMKGTKCFIFYENVHNVCYFTYGGRALNDAPWYFRSVSGP